MSLAGCAGSVLWMDLGHWGWKRAELAVPPPPHLLTQALPQMDVLGLVVPVQLSCEYPALPARENGLLHQSFKLLLTLATSEPGADNTSRLKPWLRASPHLYCGQGFFSSKAVKQNISL